MANNSSNNSLPNIRKMVLTSLFTALIIVGSYISFPLPFSPVPIVLSDLMTFLAGLVLGATGGLASVALFLFLGALGLPVFAGGKAGLAVFFGTHGGYLIGFLFSTFIIGWISKRGKSSLIKDLIALLAGNIIIYAIALPWLKVVIPQVTWVKVVSIGFLPFIIGIFVKIAIAVGVIQALRPILKELNLDDTKR